MKEWAQALDLEDPARRLACLALLAHRAPSFDALPPTFSDDFAKACDEFEATFAQPAFAEPVPEVKP